MGKCLDKFQSISNVTFRKRRHFGFSLASLGPPGQILGAIFSLVGDRMYNSPRITKALTTAFGGRSLLFEVLARGTKVTVISTTEDSSTCLFTNYNGPQTRSTNCGMYLIFSFI